jgi:hypothetical protein
VALVWAAISLVLLYRWAVALAVALLAIAGARAAGRGAAPSGS